jgi:hypothetical protein
MREQLKSVIFMGMRIPKNTPQQLPNDFRRVVAGETIQKDDVVTDMYKKPLGLVVGVGNQFATIFAFGSRENFRVFKVLQTDTITCDGFTYAIWRQA